MTIDIRGSPKRPEGTGGKVEMAIWPRASVLSGLVAHSDASSQYTSIRYTDRLAEIGAAPSIGTVGNSYDNALARDRGRPGTKTG